MIDLSDELLMAYVDGQLDKPQAAVVARIMRDDKDLAFRVSRLQETQAQLLDTFGALLREGMSSGAKGGRKSRAEKASFLSAHSAVTMGLAVFLLAIGAGLGFTGAYVSGLAEGGSSEEVVQLPPANWPEDIAEFHAFLTKESVQVSAESQSNPEMVRFQLGQLFNGVSLPDFSGQGLQFVRGQILSYRGNKIMQLVYLNRKEPLIALYIGAGGLDMPIIPGRFGDIKTVSWSENELRFVLAADMPQQALQALAVIAKSQLSKK